MGGLCSKGSAVDKSPSDTTLGPGRVVDHHDRLVVKEEKKAVVGEAAAKKMQEEQHQRQRQQPPPPPQSISVSNFSAWSVCRFLRSTMGWGATAGAVAIAEVGDRCSKSYG